MAKAKSAKSTTSADSSANLGFEAKLWLAADKLRNNMDAAEYKHVVLGLIFLKYISETFDEHHAKLVQGKGEYDGANPEDKDEYRAANVFLVPKEARWPQLQAKAKLPSIGKDVDDAMVALERDNPRLKGALNKNYGRADLDKHRLGELIDLIGSITLALHETHVLSGEGLNSWCREKGLFAHSSGACTLFLTTMANRSMSGKPTRCCAFAFAVI